MITLYNYLSVAVLFFCGAAQPGASGKPGLKKSSAGTA